MDRRHRHRHNHCVPGAVVIGRLLLALLLAFAPEAAGAWIAQAPAGGGSSFVGTCDTHGSYTLFYGTAAMDTAHASGSTKSYAYSCSGGSPATGDVLITTAGYADQTIFGGACLHTSMTATIASTVLTVTSVSSSTIAVGDYIFGTSVSNPTTISSNGTGSGGIGTYNLSVASTVSVSETMTAVIPVNVTKIYNQTGGTPCSATACDLDTKSNAIVALLNGLNSQTAWFFNSSLIRTANNYTQTGQPQGISLVWEPTAFNSSDQVFSVSFNAAPLLGFASITGSTANANLSGGSTLATSGATVLNAGTAYVQTGGFSGTTSNVNFYNPSTNNSAAGAGGTTTAASKPTIGLANFTGTKFLFAEVAFWDSDTSWNNTNFATTDASVRARQCTNWLGATC